MRTIKTPQGIKLSYQDEGDKKAPAIILIMGLGAQMTVWPDSLYYTLVKKGFRVIRFDNRDTGLSTHLEHHPSPSLFKSWLSKRLPIRTQTPYLL
ncbi:MAG: alpha/beta hydrolase, partial [Pseudomonadota bacterium]|nr:alpha/beta hydrolase [Pseudomonadota bacterium]